eukprot:scaffold2214_cov49-Phaeocystis_antarctica.AAC.4
MARLSARRHPRLRWRAHLLYAAGLEPRYWQTGYQAGLLLTRVSLALGSRSVRGRLAAVALPRRRAHRHRTLARTELEP